jgi:hypothetical protein
MPAKAEYTVGQSGSSTFSGLKEGGNTSHLEAIAVLPDNDQAFLDSFTAEQRKNLMWKVGLFRAPYFAILKTNSCYS